MFVLWWLQLVAHLQENVGSLLQWHQLQQRKRDYWQHDYIDVINLLGEVLHAILNFVVCSLNGKNMKTVTHSSLTHSGNLDSSSMQHFQSLFHYVIISCWQDLYSDTYFIMNCQIAFRLSTNSSYLWVNSLSLSLKSGFQDLHTIPYRPKFFLEKSIFLPVWHVWLVGWDRQFTLN